VDSIDYSGCWTSTAAEIWIVSAACIVVILARLGIGVDGRRDHGRAATAPDATTDQTTARTTSRTTGETTTNGETDMTQQTDGTPDAPETHDARRQGGDHA